MAMTAQDLQPPQTYKLKVADYLALDERGAFAGLRTELVGGEIIVMNPQYRPHGFVKDELHYRLRRALEEMGSHLSAVSEVSLDLSNFDMPQPDITLTNEPLGDGPIPLPSVALLVEVADASLQIDLTRKAAAYARNGIAEYWVADVSGRVIHQMWSPEGEAYAQRRVVAFGEVVEAVTVEGMTSLSRSP
jgi:Uma2 family endonuclease